MIAPARPARVRAGDGLLIDAVRVAAVCVFVTSPPQPRRSAGNPAHVETKDAAMTAPVVQDPKNKAKQEAEAAELQDRIINLQDQERQVQREMAERRRVHGRHFVSCAVDRSPTGNEIRRSGRLIEMVGGVRR